MFFIKPMLAVALCFAAVTHVVAAKQSGESITPVSFNDILWYGVRAEAAYKTPDYIRKAFPNTVHVNTVAGTDVQYFIERFPKQKLQVISIRGTKNLDNIRDDFEYWQSKNLRLGIYVHKGFAEDTDKIYSELLPHLNKEFKTRLTGHSLGAAISTLLMMYLYEQGYDIEKSVNFGQPKLTNWEGAKVYGHLPLLRLVDEDDVVPLLPATTALDSVHGKYTHFGAEVILLEGPRYVHLTAPKARSVDANSFWANLGHESVKDHMIANYIKHIDLKLRKALAVPYSEKEAYVGHNN